MPRRIFRGHRRRHRCRFAAASMTGIALAFAGCDAPPVAHQGLSSARELQPANDNEEPLQYRSAGADLARYSQLLIDPVTIYAGADAQFGSVSEDDRKSIAQYMQQTFAETLGRRYQLAAAPDADALRLHLTLTGVETSTPVISTIAHLAPVGLVINTGLQATNRNGTFFGAVSYAAELSDAATGTLLYAYVTRQTPDALDVTASFGSLAAAREGVRIGAAHLLNQLSTPIATRTGSLAGERSANP